jgi:hypothetical protein
MYGLGSHEWRSDYHPADRINALEKELKKQQALLGKYINHVGECEGTAFLGRSAVGVFTSEELETLLKAEKEYSNG